MRKVRIISAMPLKKAEQEKVEAVWAKKFNNDNTFVYETDASLIGGLRIDDGVSIYDASIKGQLACLRKTL